MGNAIVDRIFIVLCRPIYRMLFERPLWWFLAKVKAFFFLETNKSVAELSARVAALEDSFLRRSGADVNARLQSIEAANTAQWAALESLLLAMFRQQEVIGSGIDRAAPHRNLTAGLDRSPENVSNDLR
jgi:hypothetical protein